MRLILATIGCLIGSASLGAQLGISGWADSGISYISNVEGGGELKLGDGVYSNVVIFSGSESLRDGTNVDFRLLRQFFLRDGTLVAAPGDAFQEGWIRLRNAQYGAVSLGEQFDFMFDSLFMSGVDGAMLGGGFYNFRNGPFNELAIPNNPTGAMSWDRANGVPIEGSIKYISPSFGGISFGAMYGFGGNTDIAKKDNGASLGLMYRSGSLSAGAAYTSQRYSVPDLTTPYVRVTNAGIGFRYDLGEVAINSLATMVRNENRGAAAYMGQVGVTWQASPRLRAAANYMYMKGNRQLANNHAHQLTTSIAYDLSKRTFLYALVAGQLTNSGAQAQNNFVFSPSSNSTQIVTSIGFKTAF